MVEQFLERVEAWLTLTCASQADQIRISALCAPAKFWDGAFNQSLKVLTWHIDSIPWLSLGDITSAQNWHI